MLELDISEFNAVVEAVDNRWDHHDELLRGLCVLVDQLVRVCAVGLSGGKARNRLGEPFDYPRPGQTRQTQQPVRPGDIARRMRG